MDDLTLKTIFNTSRSNIDESKQFSKLNALSSNMITVDKTITGFSIQMVIIHKLSMSNSDIFIYIY